MNKKIIETIEETVKPTGVDQVDERRRKLSTVGIAGTGVLLSVASRSAMGGWGNCTGSELASTGMSRTGDANPCGCSPGYWFNNNGAVTWDKYLYQLYPRSTAKFNSTFDCSYFTDSNVLMKDCGNGHNQPHRVSPYDTSDMKNVAFHAVAALLNAAFYGNRYPVIGMQSPTDVINVFKLAFAQGTEQAMKDFVTRVDVYKSSNTWCYGEPHTAIPD